jgi:hypothetical protein
MIDARVPAPPDRPYRLGEGAREVPARAAPQPRTVQLSAASHPQSAPPFMQKPVQESAEEPGISPVSAYAPVRNTAPTGFMSGRGLY